MSVLFKGNIKEGDYTIERLGKKFMLIGENTAYSGIDAPLCIDAVSRKKILLKMDLLEEHINDPASFRTNRAIRRMIIGLPPVFEYDYLEHVEPEDELEDAIYCVQRLGNVYGVSLNINSREGRNR